MTRKAKRVQGSDQNYTGAMQGALGWALALKTYNQQDPEAECQRVEWVCGKSDGEAKV